MSGGGDLTDSRMSIQDSRPLWRCKGGQGNSLDRNSLVKFVYLWWVWFRLAYVLAHISINAQLGVTS